MALTPQDREAAKREDGRKSLVLSGGPSGPLRAEYLTDTEIRRRIQRRRERQAKEE